MIERIAGFIWYFGAWIIAGLLLSKVFPSFSKPSFLVMLLWTIWTGSGFVVSMGRSHD